MSWLDRIKQRTIYTQFVPTNEDLDNEELKNLSKQLKSDSEDKTLINILEWQDRNLKFWEERWVTSMIITFLIILSWVAMLVYLGKNSSYLTALTPILIILLIIGNFTSSILIYLVIIFLSVIMIPTSLLLVSPTLTVSSKNLLFYIGISFILGAFISLTLNMILKYKNIKQFVPEFKINDTFRLSLPIERILKYRLSICRDYAKLTSSLLLNLYPKKEIYFVLIPGHVAVAIKSNNKMYVLDQKLPILIVNKWKEKWERRFKNKNFKIELIKVHKSGGKVEIKCTKPEDTSFIIAKLDLKDVTKTLKQWLKISKNNNKPKIHPSVTIHLKNLAIFVDNDYLIRSSMIELIKNKIEDELVGNMNRITNIAIEERGENLLLKIWTK